MNPELARFFSEHPNYYEQGAVRSDNSYHAPKWRVHERLSPEDIAELTTSFKAGTAKWKLAERYGINIKSVKQLLRSHSVRKRHRYDTQP